MAGSHSVCFDRAADFYDATRSFFPAVEEEIADAILATGGATPETYFLEVGIGTDSAWLLLLRRRYF
ncbi:hypothetical protein ACVW01_001671 [Thermostichus sp. MS-CIW-19]|jgi:hypothetical protein|nr:MULTISPECIES: hypothetical protein [unclassified Synechococcus]PIK89724.1 hypothetical protein SYN65AY6A5_05320 [Synechococcus sp. 65AY6A5]PIK96361.1 hypothetical protein SYN60AY4M2_02030 [Synechococcus sp. 60AY4M2]PIK99205.1 hypothetical protein SYN63AY4M1_12975 [Synechococcus sp. 63AY4M1]PIL02354.1 hypothetical protein SYN65AY640_01140 [Synechococcus sp. 65AY640]